MIDDCHALQMEVARLVAENAALQAERDRTIAGLRAERDEWRDKAMAENALLIERTAQRDALLAEVGSLREIRVALDDAALDNIMQTHAESEEGLCIICGVRWPCAQWVEARETYDEGQRT